MSEWRPAFAREIAEIGDLACEGRCRDEGGRTTYDAGSVTHLVTHPTALPPPLTPAAHPRHPHIVSLTSKIGSGTGRYQSIAQLVP